MRPCASLVSLSALLLFCTAAHADFVETYAIRLGTTSETLTLGQGDANETTQTITYGARTGSSQAQFFVNQDATPAHIYLTQTTLTIIGGNSPMSFSGNFFTGDVSDPVFTQGYLESGSEQIYATSPGTAVQFTVESGSHTFVFDLPNGELISGNQSGAISYGPRPATLNGAPSFVDVSFLGDQLTVHGPSAYSIESGVQLYEGSSQLPVFVPGLYNYANEDVIEISQIPPAPNATTPEPSTLLLLGTGLLGVAGTVKMRLA